MFESFGTLALASPAPFDLDHFYHGTRILRYIEVKNNISKNEHERMRFRLEQETTTLEVSCNHLSTGDMVADIAYDSNGLRFKIWKR